MARGSSAVVGARSRQAWAGGTLAPAEVTEAALEPSGAYEVVARRRDHPLLRLPTLRRPAQRDLPRAARPLSLLPFLQAASVQSKVAAGESAGRSIPRIVDRSAAVSYHDMLELARGALKAEHDGYSLHAATQIEAGRRDALEHLLRYMARPPLCQGRLMLREDGKVIWNLRKPWRDGTRAFVFDPLGQEALRIERLVALIPHPREHQLTYHGCLAAASPVRDHVVPLPPSSRERSACAAGADPNRPVPRRRYYTWAELLERVFGTRVLICPRCGAARHMIATITDPAVIRRILLHLKLAPDPLPIAPAREPALLW